VRTVRTVCTSYPPNEVTSKDDTYVRTTQYHDEFMMDRLTGNRQKANVHKVVDCGKQPKNFKDTR
jgi:hypothetical protein